MICPHCKHDITLPNLTKRQHDVAQFIVTYADEHGIAPTLQEIAEGLGVAKVTVFEHVHAMQRKGFLELDKHRPRSIRLKGVAA